MLLPVTSRVIMVNRGCVCSLSCCYLCFIFPRIAGLKFPEGSRESFFQGSRKTIFGDLSPFPHCFGGTTWNPEQTNFWWLKSSAYFASHQSSCSCFGDADYMAQRCANMQDTVSSHRTPLFATLLNSLRSYTIPAVVMFYWLNSRASKTDLDRWTVLQKYWKCCRDCLCREVCGAWLYRQWAWCFAHEGIVQRRDTDYTKKAARYATLWKGL